MVTQKKVMGNKKKETLHEGTIGGTIKSEEDMGKSENLILQFRKTHILPSYLASNHDIDFLR